MTLQDILRHKGHKIYTIAPEATLEEVVQTLVRHNCGSLVVCEPEGPSYGRLVGIITERDILRACAGHQGPLEEIHVYEVMTTELVTGSPADSVEDTMGLMTSHRVRHLPIVDSGRLEGIVSIGDIVKAHHDQLSFENHYLKTYLHG